jgi:hypothetical protein
MSTTKKVEYRGRTLGEVTVYAIEDWRNESRPATERDLRLINATAMADTLFQVLKRDPRKVADEEPNQPWLLVALREVCTAGLGWRDQKMEEQALLLYVQRHGMNQILEIWGADVEKIGEELERMLAVDNVPS